MNVRISAILELVSAWKRLVSVPEPPNFCQGGCGTENRKRQLDGYPQLIESNYAPSCAVYIIIHASLVYIPYSIPNFIPYSVNCTPPYTPRLRAGKKFRIHDLIPINSNNEIHPSPPPAHPLCWTSACILSRLL